MAEESRGWKHEKLREILASDRGDELRRIVAEHRAEQESLLRKATPAQRLALMRKAEKHPLPDWLKPYRQNLIDMAIRTWEGGADSVKGKDVKGIWISLSSEPRKPGETPVEAMARHKDELISSNQRNRLYQELQRFMDFLARG